MIIKIDIDYVIRDLITPMCNLYNRYTDSNIQPNDVSVYDVSKMFPKVENEVVSASRWFFDIHGSDVNYYDAKPIPKAKEAIDLLHSKGHRIVIVSWQKSTKNKVDTLNFLEREHIYYDDICFTKNKTIVKGDLLIDDNPEFLEQNDSISVLIRAPHNVEYEKNGTCLVCDSLWEFANNICNKNEI